MPTGVTTFFKHIKRPKLIKTTLLALIVVITTSSLYKIADFAGKNMPEKEYVVEAKDGGFYPAETTVSPGDKIIFKNKEKIWIWPASDPHPTHEYLSGFDSKSAIPPGGSWSYTFTDPGKWRYHDHLNATAQGQVIVVTGGKAKKTRIKTTDGEYCDGKCFDDIIRKTVEEKGIDAAYALFQEAYDSGSLPRSCHWTAHKIGEKTYDLFKRGKDFAITQATSYCAYGFYHGFMEGLLRDNPDPSYALSFCKKVEEKIGQMGLKNCYHGIGHGYTEDPPDPKVVGNFEAMVEPGIKMCEFLFGDNFQNLNLCLTGVFTVPAGFASDKNFGLNIDPKDPFAHCKGQPERYWKACYGEFAPKLDKLLEGNLKGLPPYVNAVEDDRLKRLITWAVPSVIMSRNIMEADHSNYITACREGFGGRYRLICWGGSILGFFLHGKPENQYKLVLGFCASKEWKTESEKTFCYGEGFRQMRQNYSAEKVKDICAMAPAAYQSLCFDKENIHESPYDDPSFE